MAVIKPIYYDIIEKAFKQLSDAQLERMSYAIRKQYALQLVSSATDNIAGKISVGVAGQTGYTDIGTVTNTLTKETSVTAPNDDVPPTGDQNALPTTLSNAYHINVKNSWSYRQKTPDPNLRATANQINTSSYFTWNNALKGLQLEGNETNILDTIITDSVYQMQYGDRVGGYYIGTSAPSDGSTWENKGTIFTDTSYWNAATNFQLYLKTAASNDSTILYSTSVNDSILKFDNASSTETTFSNINISDYTQPLYTDILLPLLVRKGPKYTLSKISGNDSTTSSATWVANYSNTNYGFITERFVYSSYDRYQVVVYGLPTYRGDFRPQNNNYRYNVWAFIPNGTF